MKQTLAVAPISSDSETPQLIEALRNNLNQAIRGKTEIVDLLILAVLADGSILLEDVPGVGKTTLAKALSKSIELKYQRIQCTPDLLPADVFGVSVFNPQEGCFVFRPGPVFSNLLLVDEINRASPRTQSALLEAMAERQVTVDGTGHELPPPFLVLATQNPHGFQGTFPLPEAQLDRFLLQISLDYPDEESELQILFQQQTASPLDGLSTVISQPQLVELQRSVTEITVSEPVARYILQIVRATRSHPQLALGCSPRGSLMMFRAAQAHAVLQGRDFVLPDDIQHIAGYVLPHRIALLHQANNDSSSKREVIEEIVSNCPVQI